MGSGSDRGAQLQAAGSGSSSDRRPEAEVIGSSPSGRASLFSAMFLLAFSCASRNQSENLRRLDRSTWPGVAPACADRQWSIGDIPHRDLLATIQGQSQRRAGGDCLGRRRNDDGSVWRQIAKQFRLVALMRLY